MACERKFYFQRLLWVNMYSIYIAAVTGLRAGYISTCPFALVSEFLKKRLSGKYILAFTCPNEQADFLSTSSFFIRKMAQNPEIC